MLSNSAKTVNGWQLSSDNLSVAAHTLHETIFSLQFVNFVLRPHYGPCPFDRPSTL